MLEVYKVKGRDHVVTQGRRYGFYAEFDPKTNKYKKGKAIPDANYLGKGCALCGILRAGEDLQDFKKRTGRE